MARKVVEPDSTSGDRLRKFRELNARVTKVPPTKDLPSTSSERYSSPRALPRLN